MNETPLGPRRIEDRRPGDDEAISRLLRAVGPRREVPADAVTQAREAARAEWQRKVRQNAQRRRFRRAGGWLAVAAAALAALGLVLRLDTGTTASAEVMSLVEIVNGSVDRVTDGTRRTSLAVGDELRAGDVIETGGGGDQVALSLGRASVRLDQGTRLHLAASSPLEEVLRLRRGAVYVDSTGDGPTVVVQTALGEVRHIGTQFEVRMLEDDSLRLRVREGKVILGDADEAEAGSELLLAPDGTVTRAAVAIHGPHWDWILGVAPAFDVEGQPLSAFLDWLCREGGWTLRWDDESLATEKGPGIQFGDMSGLAPLQAAAMVLPSNGLIHRLEDGVLSVAEAP